MRYQSTYVLPNEIYLLILLFELHLWVTIFVVLQERALQKHTKLSFEHSYDKHINAAKEVL